MIALSVGGHYFGGFLINDSVMNTEGLDGPVTFPGCTPSLARRELGYSPTNLDKN